jgi:hypothetical protein
LRTIIQVVYLGGLGLAGLLFGSSLTCKGFIVWLAPATAIALSVYVDYLIRGKHADNLVSRIFEKTGKPGAAFLIAIMLTGIAIFSSYLIVLACIPAAVYGFFTGLSGNFRGRKAPEASAEPEEPVQTIKSV